MVLPVSPGMYVVMLGGILKGRKIGGVRQKQFFQKQFGPPMLAARDLRNIT
jgi:hypothetical protein